MNIMFFYVIMSRRLVVNNQFTPKCPLWNENGLIVRKRKKKITDRVPDRRVRKTQSLLRHALQDLILEKGYEAITVQDLLDRADVGRSTFYAHFRDKDELLLSGFEILHEELDREMLAAGKGRMPTVLDITRVFFKHVEQSRRAFRAILGSGSGEIVIRSARKYLEGRFRAELGAMPGSAVKQAVIEAVVGFQANALLSLLSWWLDSESTLTAEGMDELYSNLTRPGVETVLGRLRRA